MSIYLDYNASAPIDPRVVDVMVDVYKNHIGNANSRTHLFGEDTNKIVENARHQVASLFGVDTSEVIFTAGATESNNIAIQGLQEYAEKTGKKHIITSGIEHKAVLETVKQMKKRGFEIDIVNPDLSGIIKPEQIYEKLRSDTLLVCLMHVNNETGAIQPIREISEELDKREVFFHIDATQSAGKLVEELRNLKYTTMSMSAHKLGGPQGIGCLIIKKKNFKRSPIKAIMFGGEQEHGIRPGTLPVALIAGLGAACEYAENEYKENSIKNQKLKNVLFKVLKESGVKYHINGDSKNCVPSTANICFENVDSEALMISTKQYCGISNGSACTANSYKPSYVLTAMGVPQEEIECSVRISWGPNTDEKNFEEEISQLISVAKNLAN